MPQTFMNVNKIKADFQLVDYQVEKFNFESFKVQMNKKNTRIIYDVDYEIGDKWTSENSFWGTLIYKVKLNAVEEEYVNESEVNIDDSEHSVFTVDFSIVGIFVGDDSIIDQDRFNNMIELNGLASLSQISRAIITASSASIGINPNLAMPMINILKLVDMKKSN